jgi:Domain of Unknown Function (DUF928)
MTVKSKFRLASCAFLLSIFILSGFIEIPGVAAAPPAPNRSTNLWDKIVSVANVAWRKVSGKRQAGIRQSKLAGARTALDINPSEIVALIPASNEGITITDRPTFWFHLSPFSSYSTFEYMTFTLRDASKDRDENTIWSTELSTNSQQFASGLIPITYNGDRLKENNTYHWDLCYKENVTYQGVSKALEEKCLKGNLQKDKSISLPTRQTLPDRISTYATRGVWHDLITELIINKEQDPGNQQLDNIFRKVFFESPNIKYTIDGKDDIALMEKIVTAKVLKPTWSK